MTLVFTVMMFGVIAQPIRATALSAFIESWFACHSPCLFGIEPGVTMLPEVDDVLRAHPDIALYRMNRGMALDSGIIQWEWNADAPDFFARKPGIIVIDAGSVTAVEFTLAVPLAALCPTHPIAAVDHIRGFRSTASFLAFYLPLFGAQLTTPRITDAPTLRAAWSRALHTRPVIVRFERALVETDVQSQRIAATYNPVLRCPPPR